MKRAPYHPGLDDPAADPDFSPVEADADDQDANALRLPRLSPAASLVLFAVLAVLALLLR